MKRRLKTALEIAKVWLGYKPYFTQELETKLKLHGYLPSEIQPAIKVLTEELILNDEAHFKNSIEYMQLSLKWGPKKIIDKLLYKGFSFDEAQEKVKQYYQVEAEGDILKAAIAKVKNRYPNDEKTKRKIDVYLYNRGFENPKRK
ncbi:MAG: RecX family transcriptional regulator [Caldisericia bacterium]|nr:RecX family transcriptional regulator [Caldisericia bacterium]